MKEIFWNQPEKRLRTAWRLLFQVILTVGLVFGLVYPGFFDQAALPLARIEIRLMLIAVAVVWFCGRFLDRRKFADFGLHLRSKRWWTELALGTGIGLLQAGSFALLLTLLGWVTISPEFQTSVDGLRLGLGVLIDILTFASVGVFEELIRSYQVRNLAEGLTNSRLHRPLPILGAVVGASLFSMAMHLNQQGWSFWIYVFFNSLIYCLFYLWTGRIGIAIGLHFAWDFFITTIVSLGGAVGMINAAVLYSAPLTLAGSQAAEANLLAPTGFLVKLCGLLLLAIILKQRDSSLQVQPAVTIYAAPRDNRHPKSDTEPGALKAPQGST